MERRRNIDLARNLRRSMTDAETALWQHLRDRRMQGFKFRRQFPLGSYIADFVCVEARLVIELDGGQHVERMALDQLRTEWMSQRRFRVLRFWNDDVLLRRDIVLEAILDGLKADSVRSISAP
jgi:very-short-patch-repair endonuclease